MNEADLVSDDDLVQFGFTKYAAGVLHAPSNSRVHLIPTGKFFELRIITGEGDAVTVVVPKIALKIERYLGDGRSA
jgi:hypothetical protein